MRVALLFLLCVIVAGCGAEDESSAPAAKAGFAQLVVRVDADGKGAAPAKELKLDCGSAADSAACKAAGALKAADLEPVSRDKACTQIFGGPETATISGEVDGKPVDARFSRSNGCEVARWQAVSALLDRVK